MLSFKNIWAMFQPYKQKERERIVPQEAAEVVPVEQPKIKALEEVIRLKPAVKNKSTVKDLVQPKKSKT